MSHQIPSNANDPRKSDVSQEIHEFAVFKFKATLSHDDQVKTMHRLNSFISPCAGFRSREYFYSAADERWVDHLVWSELAAAKASEEIVSNPDAAALFERMDQSTAVFSRYHQASGKGGTRDGANGGSSDQVHEIIVVVFKTEIEKEEQAETMRRVGEISSQTPGFISRRTYYAEADKRWIDYIIWRDMASADASIENAEAFPDAATVFGKIDREKSVWSRYAKVE